MKGLDYLLLLKKVSLSLFRVQHTKIDYVLKITVKVAHDLMLPTWHWIWKFRFCVNENRTNTVTFCLTSIRLAFHFRSWEFCFNFKSFKLPPCLKPMIGMSGKTLRCFSSGVNDKWIYLRTFLSLENDEW